MTAVTIQSNKIVLNEVKDNQAQLEPSYRSKQTFWLSIQNTQTYTRLKKIYSGTLVLVGNWFWNL